MAKTELRDLYDKISKPDVKCEYFSDSIDFKCIIDQFKDVDGQDRPDGIILLGNTVYMVEHFQISLYLKKKRKREDWVDELQRAFKIRKTPKTGNVIALWDECDGWENQILNNWLVGFSTLLDEHLSHYPEYEKNTHEKHPDTPCEFILTVEDNSNSIISSNGLCILDIQDFVEKILSHNEIAGVIVFNTSTRGNSVIAKDRFQMEMDINNGKLRPLSSCYIHALIKEVNIGELTPEQRADLKEKICHILCKEEDSISLEDCVEVIKRENPKKIPCKKLCYLVGIVTIFLAMYAMRNVFRKLL